MSKVPGQKDCFRYKFARERTIDAIQKMSPGGVGDLRICLEGERAGGYRHFNRGGRLTWLGIRLCTTSSTCELPSSLGGMIVSKVSSATLQHFAKNSTLRLEGRVKKWQRVPARGKF